MILDRKITLFMYNHNDYSGSRVASAYFAIFQKQDKTINYSEHCGSLTLETQSCYSRRCAVNFCGGLLTWSTV